MHMQAIAELPIDVIMAALLWLLATGALWQGARHLATGLRSLDHPASALRVVRGLRDVIVAVGLAALGGGVLWTSTGLLVFGLIFLGEELYETGVLLLALRVGQQGVWSPAPRPAPTAFPLMPSAHTGPLRPSADTTRLVDG
jgi:hypothetical protein